MVPSVPLPQNYFVQNPTGFLTGPQAGDGLTIAKQYLADHYADIGLSAADASKYIITDTYTDADGGTTHVYFRQTFNNLPLPNANLTINVSKNGEVLNMAGGFVPGLASLEGGTVNPLLSPVDAVVSAANALGYTLTSTPTIDGTPGTTGDRLTYVSAPEFSKELIPVRLNYSYSESDGVRLTWSVIANDIDNGHWWDLTVDSTTGGLIITSDWVHDLNESYQVFPLPIRDPNTPSGVQRTVLVNPADLSASPFGWHDTNGVTGPEFTDTRGNNADVSKAGARPSGGTGLLFTAALDLTKAADQNIPASSIHLFYSVNHSHDVHFKYGFDEASGNFQQKNYGGQGKGGDSVTVNNQGTTNNAFMGTPPDGTKPTLTQGVFTGSNPTRDGTFDTAVTIHEFGHGVSNRLTGGPANSSALNNTQSGGMGEGWSDWWGLMFEQQATHAKTDKFPLGAYFFNTAGGIRDYPYSFTIGNAALETFTHFNSAGGSQVHTSGTRWCSTLWDMNWLLIEKYGFDPDLTTGYSISGGPAGAGNKLAMKLVMDALKLQPANPSFIDARDAILLADRNLTGGANQREIWTAFARRGLGSGATTASSNATTLTTSFTMPAGATNPAIINQSVTGRITTAPTSITFTFSEAMDTTTFNIANDVASFTDPTNADIKAQIINATWGAGNTTLTLTFNSALTTQGIYKMVLGPDIRDVPGNQLDQDFDGNLGEATQDQYTAYFRLDTTTLAVSSVTPADGGTMFHTQFSPFRVVFNENVNPATVGLDDVQLSQGKVASFNIVNATTVDYTITGLAAGPLFVNLKYNAVQDNFGFASAFYAGSYTLTDPPPDLPPTGVNAGGPYTINEGQGVTLTGAGTDPESQPVTFSWDIDGDGNFGDATGANPTLTAAQLQAINAKLVDGLNTFNVKVRVSDGVNNVDSAAALLTVNNVPPTATSMTNDGPTLIGNSTTVTINGAADVGPLDTLTFSFDFDGNGSFDDPGDVKNSTSKSAVFTFPAIGTYVVNGRVTDDDGGTKDVQTTVTVFRIGNGGQVLTHFYVTGAGEGGGPQVRVFNPNGSERFNFFAYGMGFRGGVRVATGDIDGDQIQDIITAPGPGGGPHIRVFSGATGAEIRGFFAFPMGFTGGAFVASADVNNDNWDDIVVGAGAGGGPHVRVFSGRDGSELMGFFAYGMAFGGGVSVAAGDVDGDGFADVLTGAGPGGGPHVRIFSGATGAELMGFFGFDMGFTGGVFLSAGDVNSDGRADIAVGTNIGFETRVRIFDAATFGVIQDFIAFPGTRGGARVSIKDVDRDGVGDILATVGPGNSPWVVALRVRDLKGLQVFNAYDPGFLGGVFIG